MPEQCQQREQQRLGVLCEFTEINKLSEHMGCSGYPKSTCAEATAGENSKIASAGKCMKHNKTSIPIVH